MTAPDEMSEPRTGKLPSRVARRSWVHPVSGRVRGRRTSPASRGLGSAEITDSNRCFRTLGPMEEQAPPSRKGLPTIAWVAIGCGIAVAGVTVLG